MRRTAATVRLATKAITKSATTEIACCTTGETRTTTMPDLLRAAELACKTVRSAFAAVGAATDALIRCEVRPCLPETPDASAVATRGAVDGPDAGRVSTPSSGVGPNSQRWTLDEVFALSRAQYDECANCGHLRREHYASRGYGAIGWENHPSACPAFREPTPQDSAAPPAAATDPAGVQPQAPAGSFPDWNTVALPAICDVLAEHQPHLCAGTRDLLNCGVHPGYYEGWQEWRDHLAPLIADRLASNPRPAVKALAAIYINR